MKEPSKTKQALSPSDRKKILVVIVFLGILLVLLGLLLGVLLRQGGFQFSLPSLQREGTPTSLPAGAVPALVVPTVDCGTPALEIGAAAFQIQPISPAPDGSLSVPQDTAGVAYWVEGTTTKYVFLLSPTPDNFTLLSSLPPGTIATATWRDCNSTSYTLLPSEPGSLDGLVWTDQSTEGFTVFIPSDAEGNGVLVRGDLSGEEISTIDTPSGNEIQAEISLLETTTSADGTSLQIGVSIQNYGGLPITLTVDDVTLSLESSVTFPLLESQPSLPGEIGPGVTETFTFTFPRPPTPTATLKILGVEYDIEGY